MALFYFDSDFMGASFYFCFCRWAGMFCFRREAKLFLGGFAGAFLLVLTKYQVFIVQLHSFSLICRSSIDKFDG